MAVCTGAAQADLVNLEASADTYLRGTNDKNYGVSNQLLLGSVGSSRDAHILLRFDLSGIAASATINSVTLTTISDGLDAGSQASLAVDVFELASANANWVEGLENGVRPSGIGSIGDSGPSWLDKDEEGTGTKWAGSDGASTAGTDYIKYESCQLHRKPTGDHCRNVHGVYEYK